MHRSGIKANQDLKKAIAEMKGEAKSLYMKIEISKEAFVVKGTGNMSGSKVSEDDFKTLAGELEETVACYIFFRDPTPGSEEKWVLCQYMPDLARVNSKMLYASSRASMKEAFGHEVLTEDYFISDKSEMVFSAFMKSREKVNKEDLLTFEEQAKNEAKRGEILAMSDGVALTVADVPITVSKAASDAITACVDKKTNVAILLLESNTQELLSETSIVKNAAMEDIAKVCTAKKEPRYLYHRYIHQNPETKEQKTANLFIYYCPDDAQPRMKMMYSTCKAMVLRVLEKMSVPVTNKFEASTGQELTDRVVMDELYPKKTEKVTFKKPKAGGKKGKRRLISKKKFTAS
uniref:ADF-H domain-containing protein n=1 Tax=Lotharella oceanica TaxID=641309 RepID=A0A7S2TWC2_9EUKA|mmetsp:Transcript_32836/g.61068  ORF Transcript_32836/g.61068 Transcript_32836/m.61068 type:complete len:347 (+) Transcript_32836:38-1078(+)